MPGGYIVTPLIQSVFLAEKSGYNVYLKLENTQPSGSFKDRGISHLVGHHLANISTGSVRVFSSSGGNAGLAAANAAKNHGVPCTVCVPELTKLKTQERIKKFGAEVVVHGPYWAEADRYLREVLMPQSKETPVYCHPFDDELVWEGHSSIISELKSQLPPGVDKPDAIVLSAGGAGLYCGVVIGLEKIGWARDVPVVVVETNGAPCFFESVKAKELVTIAPNTKATSLGSSYVPQRALDLALNANPTKPVLVTDEQAIDAARLFTEDHKFMVEAACGATLAVLYNPDILKQALPDLRPGAFVVSIVCGGSSASLNDYIQ